jgi:hypothetical protein
MITEIEILIYSDRSMTEDSDDYYLPECWSAGVMECWNDISGTPHFSKTPSS